MEPEVGRIDSLITEQVEPEAFSGTVHLARGDSVLFEKAYGMAIKQEAIPNRVDTRFQTASGCKIFTAIGVCMLVERGALTFDTRLADCVDVELPGFAPEITLNHLLTHTSGITSYFEEDLDPDYEAVWKDVPMYRIRGPKDFLPLFRHKKMKFRPGERFDYNDGGFILLGLAVESVTGEEFPKWVTANVLAPAAMTDSGYFATDNLPGRTAYAYIRNPDGTWRTNFFAVPIVGAPDGGAYTTAPDMAKFWRALIGHRLLDEDLTGAVLAPRVETGESPPCTHYGYGVWVEMSEGRPRKYFVEGFDPGVAMRSAYYPDSDLAITMLGNTSRAVWPLYRNIERELDL